jgi:cytochrome c-type biogenesis protein CcmH/NrfG
MSNAFYQGIASLTKKSFVYGLVGLLLGLVLGFRAANSSWRKQRDASIEAAAQQAASQIGSGGQAGNSQQAAMQAQELVTKARQNPGDFEAQRLAAEQFMQIQRPEGATEFLLQANKLKPDDTEVLVELAGAYFFQNKFPEAISWGRKALAKKPGDVPAKFYLASSLILSKQDLNEAEKILSEVEAASANAPESARDALRDMRARLNQARQESGSPSGAKTMLTHGPEEKRATNGNAGGSK